MRAALLGFFLPLAIGCARESRAQLPARPPHSRAPKSPLVGTWSLSGVSWQETTRKSKSISTVTTSESRCNVCQDVLFQENGRGAILTNRRRDTVSRFRWQFHRQVLSLRVVDLTAGSPALPTGTYRLRPVELPRCLELLDNRGVAHELTAIP